MADAGGIRAGKAFVEIHGDSSPLMRTLGSLPGGITRSVALIGGLAGGIGGAVVGAVGAAISASVEWASSLGDVAGRLVDMGDRTGIGVEALGELDHAAKMSGTSLETIEGGLKKMGGKLVDAAAGSKSAQAAFSNLGLSVADLSALSPDQQFEQVAQAISEISDPAARASAAIDVFGQSGTELLPLMKDGAKGIQGFRAEAVSLGRLSAEQAGNLDELGDTFGLLSEGMSNAGATAVSAFAPVISYIGSLLLPLVQFLAAGAARVGEFASAFLKAYPPVETLTGALSNIQTFISDSLAEMGPWGESVSGALGKAGAAFDTISANAVASWQGIGDALASGDLSLALEIVLASLDSLWQEALAGLGIDWVEIWATIEDTFNNASANIASAWVTWTTGLSTFWNDLVSTMQDLWDRFVGWLKGTFNWIANLVGAIGDDVAAEQQRLIDEATDKKIGDRNARNEGANRQIAEDRQARQDAIRQQREARTAAIRNEAETNSAAKRRADAQARLDELNARAAAQAEAKKTTAAATVESAGEAGKKAMAGVTTSQVQFGGAGASQAGAAGVFGGIEDATKETAEHTKRTADHIVAATSFAP